MPAAIAIPALIGAAGVGVSAYGARQASKAGQLSAVEKQGQQSQLDASRQLGQQGTDLSRFGMPKLQQAGGYFSRLAGGNRAATQASLAPETRNINAMYGGTARTLARFLRGPVRDEQRGELERERVGALSSLYAGARDKGIAGLVNLGQYGTGQGQAATQASAGIGGGLQQMGAANRFGAADLSRQAGADTAGLIFQLLRGMGKGGGGQTLSGILSGAGVGRNIPQIPQSARPPMTFPGSL